MAVDLKEQAQKLEEALRESNEYQAIKDAYDKVKANEESKKLFDEFRETQLKFQQMQMQGQQIEEEDLQKAQEQAQAIEKDENIAELMQAEQQMSQVFQEINQIIVKPLDEVYAEGEPPHQAGGGGVIPHPYLRTQFSSTLDHRDGGGSNGSFHLGGNGGGNSEQRSDDPYAGLMTQKEKDWLIKIQLLQVQPENPEVDDYYYVMSTKKKAERRESPAVDSGDSDKMRFIRPERVRTESKSYTPIQFERSLGKLQVVSVNYPRKILDMGVQRLSEDEERKVPPDRHLLWFRQLLLDIEKMYSAVLEHEDASCTPERQAEIAKKLFQELHPSDERFVKVVGVRKGRSLALRVLPKLKPEHQVALMAALLRHLAWLQRRDRQDGILDRGVPSALAVVQGAPTLSDLIQLAASLLMNPGAAFPGTFALRVACAIVARAEYHFGREDSVMNICNEVQRKWVKLLTEMADSLVSAHAKLSAGGETEKPDGLVTTLRLFPHERAALVSQLRRFSINFPLVSALSGDTSATLEASAVQGNLHLLQHQQNGFGDPVLTLD